MKTKLKYSKIRYLPWLIVLFFLAGCSGKTQSEVIVTDTATQTNSPMQTETTMPTFVPTITPTPRATLSQNESLEVLKKTLIYGEDCKTPCLFGIVPGQTTFTQAREIFNWLGSPLSRTTSPDAKDVWSSGFAYKDASLVIGSTLSIENDLVKSIRSSILLSSYSNIVSIREAWKAYSPDTILKQYGIPTQVMLYLDFPHEEGFPEKLAWYFLVLKYKDLDFTIAYNYGQSIEGKFIKVCPLTDQFSVVDIFIGNVFKYESLGEVPLENATSLTLAQFTDLLTQNPETACFQISKDAIFPEAIP